MRQSVLNKVLFKAKSRDLCFEIGMSFMIDAINSTFWIAWDRVTNNFNDCYKTCRDLKIIVGGRNMKKVT